MNKSERIEEVLKLFEQLRASTLEVAKLGRNLEDRFEDLNARVSALEENEEEGEDDEEDDEDCCCGELVPTSMLIRFDRRDIE